MSIDLLMSKLTASTTWPSENNPQGNAMEEVAFNREGRKRDVMGVASRTKTKGGITALDVSAAIAMANMPRRGEMLLRAMYCDDGEAAMALLYDLATDIELYQTMRCVDNVRELAEGCALAVLFPFIWGIKCKPCHSSGYVPVNRATKQVKNCDACGGSGMGRFSMRAQASKAGIPETTWRRHWKKCAEHFRSKMVEIEQECEALLIAQLVVKK